MSAFNNQTENDYGSIDVEQYILHNPSEEWGYAHGAQLEYINGLFYCSWTISKFNESDPGGRMMVCTSEDGKSWSTPRMLGDEPGYAPSGVQYSFCNSGIFEVDGKAVASCRIDEMASEAVDENGLRKTGYGDEYLSTIGVFSLESADGGKTWKTSQYCQGVAYTATELNNGRIISWSGNYTDDLTLKSSWKSFSVPDMSAAKRDGAKTIAEPFGFQAEDGTLRVFFRTDIGYLYGAESYDGGDTWTKGVKTNFTNENSMFKFGRLSDGRYYYVGNPVFNSNRWPLALLISEDGINFNQWYTIEDDIPERQFGGSYKSGYYGYPSVLEKDGKLYVAYSMNKEQIAVSAIDIASIDKTKLVEKQPVSNFFTSDLNNFKNATGMWSYNAGLGYTSDLVLPFSFSLSDTKLDKNQSFIFETDITFLGDQFEPTKEFAGLVFGSSKSTQDGLVDFSKDSYYYLSLKLKGFSRIFSNDMGEVNGHGGDISFTDDLKLLQSYHLKIDFNARTSMVDYYINDKYINRVYLDNYNGGYLGLCTGYGAFAFNNVKLKTN